MSFSKISALAGALALASTVSAHGHVSSLTLADGTKVGGWELSYGYVPNPPAVAGWATKALDNGFVAPSLYGTSDIACHLQSVAGKAYATVAAGDKINIKWDTWPTSHHGPVIDALAKCDGDDCTTAKAGDLKFFVIAKAGLVDGSSSPGKWASDELIANGNSWDVTIPAEIAPGNYVIRHEIIALHSAGNPGEAQNYPQCLNLKITGSGTVAPAGIPASQFYTASDPGIHINIYRPLGTSYVIPGPDVYSGSASAPAQPSAPVPSTPVVSENAQPSATTPSEESPAATTPSDESPVITSAPSVPSGVIPPYTNGTMPTSSSTSLPVALPEDEYPTQSTATVVPTPIATSASSAIATAVPSSPTTAPGGTAPVESPSETDSLPTGTKLSTVLAWLSKFYAKNGNGPYTSDSALKRRSHARHMRL